MVVSAETFEAEGWSDRWIRTSLAHEPYLDPRSLDPRIRERRDRDDAGA
jgi:hypothetical protein